MCSTQVLSYESIFESAEESIIGNKRSTQVNRLIDDCIVIIIVSIHFGDDISSSTSMHYASDSELYVAVFRIWFVEYLAAGVAAPEDNLLTIVEIDGRRDVVGTDFTENIFPLSKYQAYELFTARNLFTFSPSRTASMPHASLWYDSWASVCTLNALQG